ncbi:cytokine receptor [Teleopsis dalmanni]|uniref:cytokine receptor n=1 Tax=Teleopsis dalmanni TaxID=139649 RepID=UPI0018CE4033|nr:cytokine receptor [Teleopsis dalmanni]
MYFLLILLMSYVLKSIQATVPGDIYPELVEIEIGGSANITCRMNQTYFQDSNSTDLYIFNDSTKSRVPQKDIEIINNTTITFMIRDAPEQFSKYICKCGIHALAQANVYVGYIPSNLPVQDFRCLSYDFEYMICNFTKPFNPVSSQYVLTYVTQSPDYSYDTICNYDNKTVCNITRINAEFFNFTLNATNNLGSFTQYFYINNWDSMIPSKPGHDYRIINITTTFFEATWKIPKGEKYKNKGLDWNIQLTPETKNISKDIQMKSNTEVHIQLYDLPFAFYKYDLKIRVKVKTALLKEKMWSEPFLLSFNTSARLPDRPPRTSNGSFYIDSTETYVRLYWELLGPTEYNGDNFTYIISEFLNHTLMQHQSIQFENNSAKFRLDKYSSYHFQIKSSNHLGESREASIISIFPQQSRISKNYKPLSIHNVYHATNRTYTLTWCSPINTEGLLGYTVYWCNSKRALQNECNESIHFEDFGPNVKTFTSKSQEHTLNLAVSANFVGFNTGMHWSPCTMDENSDLIKMDPSAQQISASAITIQWSSESICVSILDGYNVTYCEVEFKNKSCSNLPTYIIVDKNLKKLTISYLKPYTIYKIQMRMYSHVNEGKMSDPIYLQTLECAPSPPRQLQVSNITNSSALLKWLPPSQPNGPIRNYIATVNGERYHIPNEDFYNSSNQIIYKVENLYAYTAYKVYVTAENSVTSDTSNDIHFTTLISYPSLPGSAVPVGGDNNNTVIQWAEPVLPGGPLSFYEVAVTQTRNTDVLARRISVIEGLNCSLKIPACIDHEYKTTLEVRAVNAVDINDISQDEKKSSFSDDVVINDYYETNELICSNGKEPITKYQNSSLYYLYKSEWVKGTTYGCPTNRLSKITKIALCVIVLSLGVMMTLYIARKQYNKMANINCTLPSDFIDFEVPKDNNEVFTTEILKIKKDTQIVKMNTKKEFGYSNENHHLLSAVNNEFGYHAEPHTFRSQNIKTTSVNDISSITANSVIYERTHSNGSSSSLAESSCSNISNTFQSNINGKSNYNVIEVVGLNMEILQKVGVNIRPESVVNLQEHNSENNNDCKGFKKSKCDNGYVSVNNIIQTNQSSTSDEYVPSSILIENTNQALQDIDHYSPKMVTAPINARRRTGAYKRKRKLTKANRYNTKLLYTVAN